MGKGTSVVLCVLVATGAGCGFFEKKQAPPARPPAVVSVAVAKRESVARTLDAVGTAVPMASVSVAPRVGGQIKRMYFQEGTVVAQGQLLFELDPAPYQAALAQAQATLRRDQATYAANEADADRWRKMLERRLVSPSEADAKIGAAEAARGSVAADRAAVETARLNLQWTKVRSPIGGRADRRQVDVGNLVQAGTPVVVVRQMTPMEVAFSIPEDRLAEVQAKKREGQLDVVAEPTGKHGVLSFVGGAVDPATGTVPCKARFDNEDGGLWPGAWTRVVLMLGTVDEVVVPSRAIETGQQGPFVFVVGQDDVAQLRDVKLGPVSGDVTAVEAGVAAGERVVVDGQLGVVPGRPVRIVAPAPPANGTPRGPAS